MRTLLSEEQQGLGTYCTKATLDWRPPASSFCMVTWSMGPKGSKICRTSSSCNQQCFHKDQQGENIWFSAVRSSSEKAGRSVIDPINMCCEVGWHGQRDSQ